MCNREMMVYFYSLRSFIFGAVIVLLHWRMIWSKFVSEVLDSYTVRRHSLEVDAMDFIGILRFIIFCYSLRAFCCLHDDAFFFFGLAFEFPYKLWRGTTLEQQRN